MPSIMQAARRAGGVVGQSDMAQHAHLSLSQSQMRAPYVHSPVPPSHSLPSAGSAGGQYCFPQLQPSAVHEQLSRPTAHVMPTVGHAVRSPGRDIGQSAAAQQTHEVMPCGQSHIDSSYLQLPIAGVHMSVAAGLPGGQVCKPLLPRPEPRPDAPIGVDPPVPAVLPEPERAAAPPVPAVVFALSLLSSSPPQATLSDPKAQMTQHIVRRLNIFAFSRG